MAGWKALAEMAIVIVVAVAIVGAATALVIGWVL